MILSKDILRLAGGLPLALKVFGSYLYKKSEDRWKSYIETLQRNPNSTIKQRLMISFSALELDDHLLIKMFLDIACFYIGKKNEKVVEILETYYPYTAVKIATLMKKSLLTINDRDELRMHDLLKDMGKEIARNNCPDEPGKHSRLWVPEEICYVLEEDKGTEAIEVVMLGSFGRINPFNEVSFAMETLRRMSKLRFLYFSGINLTGEFKLTLEDLRWFRWDWCPLKCLPFDFCPRKLVTLELSHSKMTTMWEVNMTLLHVSNAFVKLKTLNMSFSQDLTTTPDFRRLPSLNNLYLEGCTSLNEVHKSIGILVSLVFLNLKGCVNLRSLPDTICNLRALKVLCIEECRRLEALPMQLGNIVSLTELNACRLSVQKLPNSIGHLSKLVKLKLDLNKKLEFLPNTICNLRVLEVLSISDCTNLEALPDKLGNIESLTELNAEGLAVSRIPDSIGYLSKLVKLKLNSNKRLETLPNSICNLRALEDLNISDCTNLEALPDELGNIESLRELNAKCLAVSRLPDSIGYLSKLVKLQLNSNKKLESLPNTICNLRALEVLSINNCTNLEALPDELGKIESLRELNAECLAVSKLPDSIGYLSKLVELDLDSNKKLKTLPNTICNLRALKGLSINNCTNIEALPFELGNIESLSMLLVGGISVSKLPDSICNMRSLKTLDISECHKLERLPDRLWKLTRLFSLEVNGATLLKKLPDIKSSQTSLSLLDLSGSKITGLPSGISQLSNLNHLILEGCDHLLSIAELPPNLTDIDVSDCTSLEKLNLSSLKLLRELDLTNCSAFTEILGLEELTSLHEMYLQGCPSSLLARTLTKTLFQVYSSFRQVVDISLEPEKFPDWIIKPSVEWSADGDLTEEISDVVSQSKVDASSSVNLQPNMSYNYLGMVLCFESWDSDEPDYSVMTSASNILRSGYKILKGSGIVIVPRSIFTVTEADTTIKFTSNARRHWIHLLYENEDDSTTVNVEDERNNPSASDFEVEGGYPSKRLKLDKTGSLEMDEP